jgi:hypothetical protein
VMGRDKTTTATAEELRKGNRSDAQTRVQEVEPLVGNLGDVSLQARCRQSRLRDGDPWSD